MITKEELVVNTIHNKVNKEDIYLIGIMKKLLKDLDLYIFQNKFTRVGGKGFGMFILNKEEKSLLKGSKLSHVFLNYYKNHISPKFGRIIFELNDEYTLVVYCFLLYKKEIYTIIKSNILTLKTVFRDETLKAFQQKLVDIFGLYGSFTCIQIIFHYLNEGVFEIEDIFGEGSIKKNLGEYGKGDVTIDISILETIIKEGKEKFQEKMNLLYLLFSNINKNTIDHYQLSLFFYFLEKGIEKFKIKEKDIENQDINCEFKTYTMKMHYLCSYIFREFFDNYVYGGSKGIISFFHNKELTDGTVMKEYDGKEIIEKYKKFDLDYLKKVLLIIDQKLDKKFSQGVNHQSNSGFLSFFRNILFKFSK